MDGLIHSMVTHLDEYFEYQNKNDEFVYVCFLNKKSK